MSRRIAATLVLLSLSPGCSIPDSWSVDRGGRLYVPSDGAVYIVNPAFDKATLCVKLDKGGITHVQATPRGDRIAVVQHIVTPPSPAVEQGESEKFKSILSIIQTEEQKVIWSLEYDAPLMSPRWVGGSQYLVFIKVKSIGRMMEEATINSRLMLLDLARRTETEICPNVCSQIAVSPDARRFAVVRAFSPISSQGRRWSARLQEYDLSDPTRPRILVDFISSWPQQCAYLDEQRILFDATAYTGRRRMGEGGLRLTSPDHAERLYIYKRPSAASTRFPGERTSILSLAVHPRAGLIALFAVQQEEHDVVDGFEVLDFSGRRVCLLKDIGRSIEPLWLDEKTILYKEPSTITDDKTVIPGRLFRLHIDTGAVEDLSEAFEALGLDP